MGVEAPLKLNVLLCRLNSHGFIMHIAQGYEMSENVVVDIYEALNVSSLQIMHKKAN